MYILITFAIITLLEVGFIWYKWDEIRGLKEATQTLVGMTGVQNLNFIKQSLNGTKRVLFNVMMFLGRFKKLLLIPIFILLLINLVISSILGTFVSLIVGLF